MKKCIYRKGEGAKDSSAECLKHYFEHQDIAHAQTSDIAQCYYNLRKVCALKEYIKLQPTNFIGNHCPLFFIRWLVLRQEIMYAKIYYIAAFFAILFLKPKHNKFVVSPNN